MAQIDPELVRQLAGTAEDETIEVVFRLRPGHGAVAPEPAETERLTKELVTRAERRSGCHDHDVNVFRNMGSFVVSAPKLFVEHLIGQPEIASAVANRQPGSGMIPPASKKPAKLKDVGREPKRSPARPSRTKKR